MVESEAKELSEDIMLGAVMFGHQQFQPVIQAIIELAESCAKEPWDLPTKPANYAALEDRLRSAIGAEIAAAYGEQQKQARQTRLEAAKAKIGEAFPIEEEKAVAAKMFKTLEKEIVRGAIIKTGRRIDGRDTKTVRPIGARSASCRAPTARHSSPAARRRRWS